MTNDKQQSAHYKGEIECIDVLEYLSTTGVDFRALQAIRYLWRYLRKENPDQDLYKAEDYIHRLRTGEWIKSLKICEVCTFIAWESPIKQQDKIICAYCSLYENNISLSKEVSTLRDELNTISQEMSSLRSENKRLSNTTNE